MRKETWCLIQLQLPDENGQLSENLEYNPVQEMQSKVEGDFAFFMTQKPVSNVRTPHFGIVLGPGSRESHISWAPTMCKAFFFKFFVKCIGMMLVNRII